MENFTPVESALGGALIGLAAAMIWLLQGRICGISGIFGRLLGTPGEQTNWTLSFVVGLLLGGAALYQFDPSTMAMTIDRSPTALAVAGLLVGLGTAMGNGCTSGHGVCGLSRFSKRSLVSTCTFMATGGLAAFVVRVFWGNSL